MPYINTLSISDFRNFEHVNLDPTTNFNVFYGNNGSGKTSLLEAIYYFGFGRSFRHSHPSHLIRKTAKKFSLHLKLHTNDNIFPVGIEKNITGKRRLRYKGENIVSIAPIATELPIQLISTETYRFFHEGPKRRRQFMNWGLFHVEPSFFSTWQALLQILKQRNAALKAQVPPQELALWTEDLTSISEKIDSLRKNYIKLLHPILEELIRPLLSQYSLQLKYKRGWNELSSFNQALESSLIKDRMLGYTGVGPQRADLQLLLEGQPANAFLSQGQQKLAGYALYLAQGVLLQRHSNRNPIYLIDDFPSELDSEKRAKVISILKTLQSQVFITGITQGSLSDALSLKNTQWFHVEHGRITLKALAKS